MVVICFKVENRDDVFNAWLLRLVNELAKPWNLLMRPFEPARLHKRDNYYILELVPSFPKFYWLGYILLIPTALLSWPWFAYAPCFIFIMLQLFWLPGTYELGIKWGLKSKGSRARITFLSRGEMLGVFIWGK